MTALALPMAQELKSSDRVG